MLIVRLPSRQVLLTDAPYLPLQQHGAVLEDAAAHLLAERFDVCGCRGAEIDQKVAMLLGDLCVADPQPAAAGAVDQLPRLEVGGIGEGRTAGAAARLGLRPRRFDLGDASRDREPVPGSGP